MNDAMEFSGDFRSAGSPAEADSSKNLPLKTIKGLLSLLIICSLLGSIYYVYSYKPEIAREFLLKIDRFGLTPVGQREQQRLQAINQLPITYAEKQVLINRTVFLGASTEMVILALGEPKKQQHVPPSQEHIGHTTYVYHFPKDPKPILLRFRDNQLTTAEKASAIDISTR